MWYERRIGYHKELWYCAGDACYLWWIYADYYRGVPLLTGLAA
jgi:hypothetical protein